MKYIYRIFMGAVYFALMFAIVDLVGIKFAICVCGAYIGVLGARISQNEKP